MGKRKEKQKERQRASKTVTWAGFEKVGQDGERLPSWVAFLEWKNWPQPSNNTGTPKEYTLFFDPMYIKLAKLEQSITIIGFVLFYLYDYWILLCALFSNNNTKTF